MELFLNLTGALITIAMVCLWLRFAPRSGAHRGTQLVALALLVLILFPMISMTDDLLAVQNPAETDCYVCVDHLHSSAHSFFPATASMPAPPNAEHHSSYLRDVAPGTLPASIMNPPALAPVENRPPPAAA
jgi:hypothetical protein